MTDVYSFDPIYNENSRVLILGTMPSPKSREVGFYYSHPQNRFWKVMAGVFSQDVPATISEKKLFLLNNNIALWDVLRTCKIKNADDSSISEPVVNDIAFVLKQAKITAVFTTGRKATDLYNKHCIKKTKFPAIYLPSTSPANCRLSAEKLAEEYKVILDYLPPLQ